MLALSSSSPSGAASARARSDASATVNVPLFSTLIERFGEDRRWVVLDLAAVRPRTIELLSRYRCRLDIADLDRSIDSLSDSDDSTQLAADVEALLPGHPGEPTDAVFCWDFMNYMERDVLTALMSAIASRCRSGALVHALISYSQPMMQERPGQLIPVDEGHLESLAKSAPSRTAPRYSTEALRLCLPDFSIERVRLLSNGMQEYLFVR